MLKSSLGFAILFLLLPLSTCITQFTTIYRVNQQNQQSRLHVKVEVYGPGVYRYIFSILDQSKSIITYIDGTQCRTTCTQIVAVGGLVSLSYTQRGSDFVIFEQNPTSISFYFKGCLQDLSTCRISQLPGSDFSVCEDSTSFDSAKPMFDCNAVPLNTTTAAETTTLASTTTEILTTQPATTLALSTTVVPTTSEVLTTQSPTTIARTTSAIITTSELLTTQPATTFRQLTTEVFETTTIKAASTSVPVFSTPIPSTLLPFWTASTSHETTLHEATTIKAELTSVLTTIGSTSLSPLTTSASRETTLVVDPTTTDATTTDATTTFQTTTQLSITTLERSTVGLLSTTTILRDPSTTTDYQNSTDDSNFPTEKLTTLKTTTTTETPVQVLKNLSDSGVSLDNVTDVLDTTLSITDDPQDLSGEEIYYVANILTESANLTGLPEVNALSILQNMDNVMSASLVEIQQSESQQKLLDVLPLMVSNCNASSIQFLGGMNLGFASNSVGAQATFNGLVDKVHNFEIVSGNVENGKVNAISVPQSFVTGECNRCGGIKNVFFTIYRNRKLFNTAKKYRPYQSFAVANEGQNDGVYPDPCDRQTQIPEDAPVMTATVTNGEGAAVSRLSVQRIMAQTQFNVTSLLRPLHGHYQVTWWDVDNQNWATSDLCQSELKNGMVYSTCDHLTDFTLIVDGMANDPNVCVQALTDVSIATNTVSLVSLLFLILIQISAYIPALAATKICGKLLGTSVSYPDTIQLFFNLVLFLFYLVFMIFSDQKYSGEACDFMAALAYSLLLCSILLTIFQAQRNVIGFFPRAVRTFNAIVLRPLSAFTICFICPFVLSLLLSFFTPFFKRNDGFCWVRPDLVIYATIIPVSVLIFNAILCTSIVIWRMCQARRKVTKHGRHHDGQLKTKILSIVVLQITMGMPWIVQYFTLYYPEATAWHYIFSIVIGSQGTMLALIYFYKRHKLYRRNTATNRRKLGVVESQASGLAVAELTGGVISIA